MTVSCQPVFVMASMLPPETVADTASLCTACEAVGGRGSMKGAQRIRGQWRLYPNTRAARDKLLLEGFMLGGTKIQPLDKNPFLLHPGGEEIPSTRLWIGNVPISCDDGEIAKALTKLGCELISAMKAELARNADRKLTNWVTGRRFVEITVPKEPLPTRTQVGIFSATLYHKEQREKRMEERTCTNCLEKGHLAATCMSPVVCRECRKTGHKRGDPACTAVTPTAPVAVQQQQQNASSGERAPVVLLVPEQQQTTAAAAEKQTAGEKESRQPMSGKQTAPRTNNAQSKRPRSRSLSRDRDSKGLRQARLDEPSSAAPCFAPWLRCEDSGTMDTCGEQGSETGKTQALQSHWL